jgi:hypothetical protein
MFFWIRGNLTQESAFCGSRWASQNPGYPRLLQEVHALTRTRDLLCRFQVLCYHVPWGHYLFICPAFSNQNSKNWYYHNDQKFKLFKSSIALSKHSNLHCLSLLLSRWFSCSKNVYWLVLFLFPHLCRSLRTQVGDKRSYWWEKKNDNKQINWMPNGKENMPPIAHVEHVWERVSTFVFKKIEFFFLLKFNIICTF